MVALKAGTWACPYDKIVYQSVIILFATSYKHFAEEN
jgi:hypothetical protein